MSKLLIIEKQSFAIFIVYFVLIVFLSWTALFVGRALEDPVNFDKIVFYTSTGFVLLLWVFFDHTQLTGSNQTFTVLHNPSEQAIKRVISGFNWRWFNNPFRIALLTLVVFIPFYLFALLSAQKTFFVGFVTYQVSPIAEVFLAGEPAAFVETLILLVPAGFALWLAKKYSDGFRNKLVYWSVLGVSSFLITQLMVLYHGFRYAGSDVDLQSVFGFFFISIWIFYVTGSAIPPLLLHLMSNSFGAAFSLFSSDVVLINTVILYFIVLIIYFIYLFNNHRNTPEDNLYNIR